MFALGVGRNCFLEIISFADFCLNRFSLSLQTLRKTANICGILKLWHVVQHPSNPIGICDCSQICRHKTISGENFQKVPKLREFKNIREKRSDFELKAFLGVRVSRKTPNIPLQYVRLRRKFQETEPRKEIFGKFFKGNYQKSASGSFAGIFQRRGPVSSLDLDFSCDPSGAAIVGF